MATLVIKRPSGFFQSDGWRSYIVRIDEQEVGKVRAGKTVQFDLSPGEHKVQLGLDWGGSNTLTLHVMEGQEIRLICGSSGNGMAAIFSPNDYLWLDKEQEYKRHKRSAWATTKGLFKTIPLTMGLIVLLTGIFVLEMCFNIGSYDKLSPNIQTLVAFGGLYHPALSQSGEWYRLFSPVLLHGSVIHLLFNCYALLLAGVILENLIGRVWYLAVFLVGGVGGSLMSLVINPPTLISVGASGAIMGLFAAALVCSFHLPKDARRKGFQLSLVQILVVSLLPFLGAHTGQHIDIAAHLGGTIAGGVIGAVILLAWKGSTKPGFRNLAVGLCLLTGTGYVYAALPVAKDFHTYALADTLIPQDQLPTTDADAVKRAKDLLAKYPNDPRSHLYTAIGDAQANDIAGAEKELRQALSEDDVLTKDFQPGLKTHIQAVLAIVLLQRGDAAQAKQYAAPLCQADNGDPFRQNLVNNHLCD